MSPGELPGAGRRPGVRPRLHPPRRDLRPRLHPPAL